MDILGPALRRPRRRPRPPTQEVQRIIKIKKREIREKLNQMRTSDQGSTFDLARKLVPRQVPGETILFESNVLCVFAPVDFVPK